MMGVMVVCVEVSGRSAQGLDPKTEPLSTNPLHFLRTTFESRLACWVLRVFAFLSVHSFARVEDCCSSPRQDTRDTWNPLPLGICLPLFGACLFR